MLVENFIQKLSKPEEEDDQFNCIRRIEFEATKDTGVIAGLTVMKIIKEEGSEDLGTVIGVDLDEDLQSWMWLLDMWLMNMWLLDILMGDERGDAQSLVYCLHHPEPGPVLAISNQDKSQAL